MSKRGHAFRFVALAWLLAGRIASGFETEIGGRPVDLDGSFALRGALRVDGDTAPDDFEQVLRLRLGAELTDWLDFDIGVVGINGGPTSRATKAGGFNYNDAFQDVDPSFEVDEAYFDLLGDEVELRLGLQKVHWGKLDRQQPNDLLNPYRFIDPFLTEQDERKIGIPGLQLTYAPGGVEWLPEQSQLTAVWAAMYVPFRLPVLGERWFPPAAVPPATFDIPANTIRLPDGSFLPGLEVPISTTTDNIDPPPRRLENTGLGLRASAYSSGVDYAFYYYHGFDVQPAVGLLVDAVAAPNPTAPIGFDVSAETTLQPVYSHIDSLGADAAYTIGPFTVRGEGAFILDRAFSRNLRDLITNPAQLNDQIVNAFEMFRMGVSEVPIDVGPTFVEKNSLEWGVGADYTRDGWFALLQLNQTDVFDNDVNLLIDNVETRFLVNLRKSFLEDRLRPQLIGVYGVSGYLLLQPRLTYVITDYLDLQAGYLLINGSRNTIIGQYKDNDEAYLRLRVTF